MKASQWRRWAVCMGALFLAGVVVAEVVIYDVSFNATGGTVNYPAFEGGYLVVDEGAASVGSVVVMKDPNTFVSYYETGLLDGSVMSLLSQGGGENSVFYSSGGGGGQAQNLAYQLLGKGSGGLAVGGDEESRLARKLRGYMLTSTPESFGGGDSTTGNSTGGNGTFSYGFAGASKLTATFSSGITREANRRGMDASSALQLVETRLQNRGIYPESGPNPSPTPSPTPGPSPVPSPTP